MSGADTAESVNEEETSSNYKNFRTAENVYKHVATDSADDASWEDCAGAAAASAVAAVFDRMIFNISKYCAQNTSQTKRCAAAAASSTRPFVSLWWIVSDARAVSANIQTLTGC
jgi:hypothetical protein